jgi:hypothetical protein
MRESYPNAQIINKLIHIFHMKKAEIIIATLSVIAIGMNLLSVPGSGILITLTLSSLSLIYCYFGFALFNNIPLRKIFNNQSYKDISVLRIWGAIVTGFILSATLIGILFKLQSWAHASYNLGAGLVGLLIVTAVGLIKYQNSKADYYVKIFIRIAIFGGIGLVFMFI